MTPSVVSQTPSFPGSLYRIVTPVGDVMVLTSVALAGNCLGSRGSRIKAFTLHVATSARALNRSRKDTILSCPIQLSVIEAHEGNKQEAPFLGRHKQYMRSMTQQVKGYRGPKLPHPSEKRQGIACRGLLFILQ